MKFTFGRKILLGYGVIIVLLIVIVSLAEYHIFRLGSASQEILKENYESILASENMIGAIERQDSSIILRLLEKSNQTLEQFKKNEGIFYQWLARAKDNITIQGEADILNRIEEGYASFLALFIRLEKLDNALTTGNTAQLKEAVELYRDKIHHQFLEIRNDCIALRELNQNMMYQASANARGLASRSAISTLVVGVVVVIFGLVFSLIILRIVIRPVKSLTSAAVQVGGGNLSVTIPKTAGDEIGILALEFNKMVKSLREFQDMNVSQIVSEKKKSEAIVRSIKDGIIICDSKMRITSINSIAGHIFGVSESDVINKPFLEVTRQETLFEYLQETVKGKTPSIDEDVITVAVDGHKKYYRFAILPIKGESSEFYGIVIFLQDITRLKELDKMKSEFVMMASHELRTPLTSIEMGVKLVLEESVGEINEQQRTLLQAAQEELDRLKVLVNDLLELSRIEQGNIEMDFDDVEIQTLCTRAFNIVQPQAQDKEISFSLDLEKPNVKVRADVSKVIWVITNLLGNAVRYTERGGWIKLKSHVSGDWAYISVMDNGTGIPLEYQSKIFDKFVQLKGEEARGSGLGLTIAREIVRAHGGTIWVEGEVNKGSTFTFTLPVVRGSENLD
ncbi:MAG: ATP-binding protein [Candidatus Aminicenantes bacterium]|nr:ATP-binding protein [Candidatus Aminicenantes bacterium]MDH5385508.1 ATP-binding protein [Candidatus Aminicenantes bacterium]